MNKIELSAGCYKLRILLMGLLALLFIIPNFAIAGYIGDNIAISDKAYDQQNPHTIYLPDKDLWFVVWEDWRNFTSTGADIRGQFINSDGTFCGNEFVISNSSGNQTVPRAAYRQDFSDPTKSKVVVVWQDTRPNYVYSNEMDTIDETSSCTYLKGTEKPIGFNPIRLYSDITLSTEYIGGEEIGVGDGSNATFTATLFYKPVHRNSVTVTDGTQTCIDDGAGGFTGDCSAGMIDYDGTGLPGIPGYISVTFNSAPANRRPVTVQYQYEASVSGQKIGSGEGATYNFSAVLNSPVKPSDGLTYFVEIKYDSKNFCRDNGSGNFTITAVCGGGSINYTSGSVGVTFINPPGFPGVPTDVNVNYTFLPSITGERISTANGAATTFAGVLNHTPVVPGAVQVKSGNEILVDDGFGTLKRGVTSAGNINYNSGTISATFSAAPVNGEPVTVEYYYYNHEADYSNDLIGYGNGSDKNFRETLTFAPVIPGSLSIVASGGGVPTLNDDSTGRLTPPVAVAGETIGTGDGVSKTFTNKLSYYPVVPTSVGVVSGVYSCNDSGLKIGCTVSVDYDTGFIVVLFNTAPASPNPITVNYSYYAGTINYESGVVSINYGTAPAAGAITASYTYRSFPPGKVSATDILVSRRVPRIAYDPAGDRFWIVWKETRNILHQISELCFADRVGAIADWSFDDSDFIGYVRLDGSTLYEQNSILDVAGADIIRNSDATTVREVSSSILALSETREYESFMLATNPDVACDETSTQCLIVSEGLRTKQTLTCTCQDKNSNSICDLADVVTSSLASESFDDGFVHIYGISDNYVSLSTVSSMKLDSATGTASHYPSVGFDPITKTFLTAWEDLRGGSNTKIYGQLVYSGGGLYNNNFIISYEDTDGINGLDPNVANSKQTKPFVSYDSVNQRFFVVWQDGRNSTLSLENLDIYGQKVDAEGSLRGYNFAVFTLPYNQYNPTIAYNDVANRFIAVWKDARNTDQRDCSLTGTPPWNKPCGSDVYGQIFTLGQPSLTLLNPDNTPLTPPLLNKFENPAGSGHVEVGLFHTQSFKIRNTGDTTLKIDYIDEDLSCNGASSPRYITPFSFDGLPSQLTARGGDTINLVPSAELSLTVRFTPTAGGSYNKCFIIESDGGNPQVNLSALAVEADITITPTSYNFGDIYIGSYGEKTFVVRNTGLATLRISSINNPSTPFSIYNDGCSGKDIAPGSTCDIKVRFIPTTTTGSPFSSLFGINSNDPDTPTLNVNITGGALGAADITVTPLSINFGNVQIGGTGSQQTITVKNDGTADLTITSISSPVAPFSIVSNTCKNSVPPAPAEYPFTLTMTSSCQLIVRFAPAVAGGSSSSIKIQSNDPDEANVTVNLSGTGVTTPDIEVNGTNVSPAPVVFPGTVVGSTSTQTITVRNIGTANLTITGLTNPTGEFTIASSTCIGTIAPSGSCTVSITFAPTSGGFKTSSFLINSNDPDTPAFTVSLSGIGAILPDITVTPTTINFGNIQIGQSSQKNITIKNDGSATLTINSISSPVAPFSIVSNGGCPTSFPFTLAIGNSCQVTVKFAPTLAGLSSSSIAVSSNDPDEGTVNISLNGTGVHPPNINLSTTLIDFHSVPVGGSTQRTLTVSNTGDIDLTITSVSKPNSPYSILVDHCSGSTLAHDATCSITIVFNPTFDGIFYPYYMTISSNDPDESTIQVTLKGETGILKFSQIPGLTGDSPALAWNPIANKMQIVVRGSDGPSIWAGTFNPSGVFNNDWTRIPGATPGTPALAWNPAANKMQIVVRGSDGPSIWAGTFNSSGVFNNDWINIPGLIADSPALVWNPVANELQMAVRASDGTIWASTFNSSGVFNNDWFNISGLTANTPALAWNPAANKMQIVVRASNNTLWIIMY